MFLLRIGSTVEFTRPIGEYTMPNESEVEALAAEYLDRRKQGEKPEIKREILERASVADRPELETALMAAEAVARQAMRERLDGLTADRIEEFLNKGRPPAAGGLIAALSYRTFPRVATELRGMSESKKELSTSGVLKENRLRCLEDTVFLTEAGTRTKAGKGVLPALKMDTYRQLVSENISQQLPYLSGLKKRFPGSARLDGELGKGIHPYNKRCRDETS